MPLQLAHFEHWNAKIGEAITSLGTSDFPRQLEAALRTLIDFDKCLVYSYSKFQKSASLYHNVDDETVKLIVDEYLSGPYLLDPFYSAVAGGKRAGFGAIRTLAPDHFTRSEFYRHHYVRTGIADEIGIFFQIADDKTAVLSISRQKPRRMFNESERKLFASVMPIVEKFGAMHWSQSKSAEKTEKARLTIDNVFDGFGRGVVTAREREIVALVLKGHSSPSIGQVLNISEGTVKIHRKHAYDKLKISSQAELFSLFLDALEQHLEVD